MIRVLHVLGGLDFGGAETMVMNFYRNIDRQRIQFDFVIHSNKKQDYEDEVLSLGGRIFRFPRYKGINTYSLMKTWDTFLANHSEFKVIHSHVRSYASLYLMLAKKYKISTIVHSHSTSNGTGLQRYAKELLQLPLRYEADYLFACSEGSGKWLYGDNVINKSNFYIVKNAIDTVKYLAQPNLRLAVRKEFGFGDERVFGHIGRIHEAKNHQFLLQLFQKLHEFDKKTKLLIVGDGPLMETVVSLSKKLNLSQDVIFTGARKDIPELLQAMDCFLFPSKWEGLPLSVIEAQAAGLPTFISSIITDEVVLSDLVHKVPINNGIEPWIDSIAKSSLEKKNVANKISDAGFDIKSASTWLEDFYLGLN